MTSRENITISVKFVFIGALVIAMSYRETITNSVKFVFIGALVIEL